MAGDEGLVYLDSSALVKLVLPEEESAALVSVLPRFGRVTSSALARVEVHRAVRRVSTQSRTLQRAHEVLDGIYLIPIDDLALRLAADLRPDALRSLDALHLATALRLGSDLTAMIVYDDRLAEAAQQTGLEVLAPR